jgi:hypothetical protein
LFGTWIYKYNYLGGNIGMYHACVIYSYFRGAMTDGAMSLLHKLACSQGSTKYQADKSK